jgi:superfamily I DNA/RNA helicase
VEDGLPVFKPGRRVDDGYAALSVKLLADGRTLAVRPGALARDFTKTGFAGFENVAGVPPNVHWSGGRNNICVVGDDDQSIYRFRGATIENILSFEEQYRGCRTIRLEQNYRSSKNILSAANAVIRNNQGRKGKELWTAGAEGDKVRLHCAMNEHDEAHYVATRILEHYRQGMPWKAHAILYRMNAQSNLLELAFKRNGIPYRIIGGHRFFDRAEVKDMLAYLCTIHNPHDDLRLREGDHIILYSQSRIADAEQIPN